MERGTIASFVKLTGLHTLLLDESHIGFLPDLHERCRDFIQLTTGQPSNPMRWVLRCGGHSLRRIVQAQNVRGLAFWRQGGFEVEGMTSQGLEAGTNTVYKMVRHLTVPEEGTV